MDILLGLIVAIPFAAVVVLVASMIGIPLPWESESPNKNKAEEDV